MIIANNSAVSTFYTLPEKIEKIKNQDIYFTKLPCRRSKIPPFYDKIAV
jgi:hypothetical protein